MTPDTIRNLLVEAQDKRKNSHPDGNDFHYYRGFCAALMQLLVDAPAGFQARVGDWLQACFGPAIAANKTERNHRFLEESLELVQACGCTQSEAHQLVDYVYGRPIGEIGQEVGGVMNTLAALCLAHGFDMAKEGETEIARCWTKIEKIRAKQAAKPKHSPLPEAPATPVAPRDEEMARSIERILIGGNHLATYSGDWPSWQLDGLTRAQQCELALRKMGATKDYDMWVCWSTIMQERDTLAAAHPLLTRQSTRRTDEDVEREIERHEKSSGLLHRQIVKTLRWTLNKTEPGR
jgi:hypothetical protein